ncbi:MAG TPA: hypothetical protein VG816_01335 [Solirubrobacterales bacterium]|nr:hypothetical protein [Solirubrobacterales bacterium]
MPGCGRIGARQQSVRAQAERQRRGERTAAQGAEESSAPQARGIWGVSRRG